jgi:hypothetical protein
MVARDLKLDECFLLEKAQLMGSSLSMLYSHYMQSYVDDEELAKDCLNSWQEGGFM